MRSMLLLTLGLLIAATPVRTQPPERGRGQSEDVTDFIARMLVFDTNKDGKLTRDEITDERLLRLFDRADANKDGTVTKEELTALFEREGRGTAGGRAGPPDGRGGLGSPGGRGPRPGQVLPDVLRDELDLTEEQKQQIADLQKEVDRRLDRILTRDQKARLRGPGDRGRPGP